jgi:hypothetical protein
MAGIWDFLNPSAAAGRDLLEYKQGKKTGSAIGEENVWLQTEGPDFLGAEEKEKQSRQEAIDKQLAANRPDINGPFGSQAWTQGPDGKWSLSTGFGGQLGGASSGLQGMWADNVQKGLGDGAAAREQAINAAYGQAASRLDPQWSQREEQMKSQLVNQGLDQTSQAYRDEMDRFGQQRTDAYGSAMNNAIGQGTQAQQATFQQNLASFLAPLQGMQGMQGLLNGPSFNTAGNSGGIDYGGALASKTAWQQNRDEQMRKEGQGAVNTLTGAFT